MPFNRKSLKTVYPELESHDEFKSLNPAEMLFVWYYACEASPLSNIDKDRDRAEKAIEFSFWADPKKKLLSDDLASAYKAGRFPDKLSEAIIVMSSFKMGARIRGLKILEKGFQNLEKLICVDESSDVFTSGEVSKQKDYVTMIKSSTELMPKIIEQLEQGFSVKRKNSSDSSIDGISMTDDWHSKH